MPRAEVHKIMRTPSAVEAMNKVGVEIALSTPEEFGRLIESEMQRWGKLIRTLGWIERGMVTAYWSYRLTHNQVSQWRDNQRVLAGLEAPTAPLAVRP